MNEVWDKFNFLYTKKYSFAWVQLNFTCFMFSFALSFFALKKHRQTSIKHCFEKYCSCDKVCQFSALFGKTYNWRQIYIYKQTNATFYSSNDVYLKTNFKFSVNDTHREKILVFSENFAYVLNKWSLTLVI